MIQKLVAESMIEGQRAQERARTTAETESPNFTQTRPAQSNQDSMLMLSIQRSSRITSKSEQWYAKSNQHSSLHVPGTLPCRSLDCNTSSWLLFRAKGYVLRSRSRGGSLEQGVIASGFLDKADPCCGCLDTKPVLSRSLADCHFLPTSPSSFTFLWLLGCRTLIRLRPRQLIGSLLKWQSALRMRCTGENVYTHNRALSRSRWFHLFSEINAPLALMPKFKPHMVKSPTGRR